jgi:hypothetical protein
MTALGAAAVKRPGRPAKPRRAAIEEVTVEVAA